MRLFWVLLLLPATSGLLSAQADGPARLVLDGPVVLQDGQAIVFSGNFTPQGALGNTSDLYALGAGGVRRLTAFPPNPAYIDLHSNPNIKGFDATPEGSRIAVATNTGVLTVDAATGAQQLLYSTAYADTPRITPDGRTVLMSIHPFTGHLWFPYLYSVPIDGGALVKLARGTTDGRHPISDDGIIVFTSPGPANDATTTDAPRDVYTMSPGGADIKQLTHFTGPISFQTPWASLASITPDGKRILFITQVPTGPGANDTTVWTVNAGGQQLRSLPIDPNVQAVAFSRDGTLVAWNVERQIHVMKVDTGEDRQFADFNYSAIPGAGMEFAPDNSALYFLLGQLGGNGSINALPIGGAIASIDLRSGSLRSVYAPRTIAPGGIVESVTDYSKDLTPGGLVTVYGSNLTSDALSVAPGFPLATFMAGVSLLIDGKPAPWLATTPWQVNAAIPMDTPLGQATFQLRFADGTATQSWTANVVASPHTVNGSCMRAAEYRWIRPTPPAPARCWKRMESAVA
jgi:tricorn protease-like protein